MFFFLITVAASKQGKKDDECLYGRIVCKEGHRKNTFDKNPQKKTFFFNYIDKSIQENGF